MDGIQNRRTTIEYLTPSEMIAGVKFTLDNNGVANIIQFIIARLEDPNKP